MIPKVEIDWFCIIIYLILKWCQDKLIKVEHFFLSKRLSFEFWRSRACNTKNTSTHSVRIHGFIYNYSITSYFYTALSIENDLETMKNGDFLVNYTTYISSKTKRTYSLSLKLDRLEIYFKTMKVNTYTFDKIYYTQYDY